MNTYAPSSRARTTAILLVLAALATGCGASTNPYEATGPEDTARAAARLENLPSLEKSEAAGRRSVEELGAYITGLVPDLRWEWVDERRQSGCHRPYDQTRGKRVKLPNYVAAGSIPERVRADVVQRARELGAEFGADEGHAFQDEPGSLDIRFSGDAGTSLTLIDAGNTVITANTGCRLPQAAFDPGTPNPPTPTP
ncbi:hypothetical protein DW322_15280 [Rhodococcus rhodnii]|uniref:Lipoprotein LppV n=2 Tax=Rhodococcus rhodnii TaxID=38312 RepID=R7WTD2_9NOCA|nr:LppA family lipoprotein [Rhodococcus rhodnii]EOM78532.1 lipoprotein LppV [Rhodococcus rhodnii LMG 5362]TXG91321.1 hypothetical protein DW322_15280 [Rhodococcus rhodnii]